jgi:putative radical SAM enzyme (TIGR03279 family)
VIAVKEAIPGTLAAELGLAPGDQLMAIDGEPLEDFLDFNFLSAEPVFTLEVVRRGLIPRREIIDVVRDLDEEFGLVLEPPAIKRCTNKCDFCFIDQMPTGLRRSLYVKDEDYRYSFLYGNFVTTTNLREKDFQRILRYRLSPLYISVHATDPTVRERILKNPKAGELLSNLGRLAEGGIRFHTQVVLCPGVNDGDVLLRTFDDLLPFGEALLSVSVVPVGLTGHRQRLAAIEPVTATYAREIVELVDAYRERSRGAPVAALDWSKIQLSDEFYLQAELPLPGADAYGEFALVENGVGMTRLFLEEFEAGLDTLEYGAGHAVGLLTGRMMAPLLETHVAPALRDRGWRAEVVEVENGLFGSSVTCAGLLGGRDLLVAARSAADAELVLYPAECLNIEGCFLDDVAREELAAPLAVPVWPSRTIVDELNEFSALVSAATC